MKKRKDKICIFRHLMTYRGFNYTDRDSVNMLNMIPIVFYNNKNVIAKYNEYIKSLTIKEEDFPIKEKEIFNNKTHLLESMAKVLKYKNIDWKLIQNPYIPIGLINAISSETLFKQGQLAVAEMATQMNNNNKTEKISIKKKS